MRAGLFHGLARFMSRIATSRWHQNDYYATVLDPAGTIFLRIRMGGMRVYRMGTPATFVLRHSGRE